MKDGKRCFCNSCWRDEYHSPVRLDGFTRLMILVLSLGTAALFWPYRCHCCGSLRPLHWFAKRA